MCIFTCILRLRDRARTQRISGAVLIFVTFVNCILARSGGRSHRARCVCGPRYHQPTHAVYARIIVAQAFSKVIIMSRRLSRQTDIIVRLATRPVAAVQRRNRQLLLVHVLLRYTRSVIFCLSESSSLQTIIRPHRTHALY